MGKTVSAAIIQTILNSLHASVLKYKQYRSVCAAAPKIQGSYNYMCMSEKNTRQKLCVGMVKCKQDKLFMCNYAKHTNITHACAVMQHINNTFRHSFSY